MRMSKVRAIDHMRHTQESFTKKHLVFLGKEASVAGAQ